MKAIMLTAEQIPTFWEAIKFGMANAEGIKEERLEEYFNRLLYMLLAGKAQCFVRLDDSRKLQMLGITSVKDNPVASGKILFCYGLFSFAKVPNEMWIDDFSILVKWARTNECKEIITWSNNQKAIDLLTSVGMKEDHKMFRFNVGGV
jgi:hypothetical protein